MAKTAVGLFENSGSADGVVRDLTAKGFLQKDIRVLGEPVEMPGSGLMSTPHTDFEVDLIRDLTAFGVVRRGRGSVCPRRASWRCHGFRNRYRQERGPSRRNYELPRCLGD